MIQLSLKDAEKAVIKEKQKECAHEYVEVPLFCSSDDRVYYVNFCPICGKEVY